MKEDVNVPTEAHLADLKKRIHEIHTAQKKELLIVVQKWGEREQVFAVREGQDL